MIKGERRAYNLLSAILFLMAVTFAGVAYGHAFVLGNVGEGFTAFVWSVVMFAVASWIGFFHRVGR